MFARLIKYAAGYRVKNIKSFMGMDAPGFNCSVYHNGKRIGDAIDEGNGGMIFVRIDNAADQAALTAHASQHHDFEADGCFIATLVQYQEVLTKMKRKKKLFGFIPVECKLDEMDTPTNSFEWKCDDTPAYRAKVQQKYPNIIWIKDEIEKAGF